MQLQYLFCLIFFLLASSCHQRQNNNEANGYVEGRYTYMATPVSGVLKQLFVMRGSQVKKGDRLFSLEAQPESDIYNATLENLNQSIASRDAILANLAFAKITYERYKILVPKNAIDQSHLDSAKATYNASLAQLAQSKSNIASAEATLAQTKWTKDQKDISAPVDGIVFDTYYRIGEYTIANQAVLSLLAPADIKAIFYVNEGILGGLRLGDNVTVHCDGCHAAYTGRISFISPSAEYTPPVIYSEQTNETLVFRIEASFTPDIAYHLHPGQPITVTLKPHG